MRDARDVARTDGLAGAEVAFDDITEDFPRPLVELGETDLRRPDWDVLCHRIPSEKLNLATKM